MTLARPSPGRRGGENHFSFPTLLRWISRMVETRLGINAIGRGLNPFPIARIKAFCLLPPAFLNVSMPNCGLLILHAGIQVY